MDWKQKEIMYLDRMEEALTFARNDPLWILKNFAYFPFDHVSKDCVKYASGVICEQLDTIKEFENVDILYSPDGIFKVCPLDTRVPLVIVDCRKKTINIAKVREIKDDSIQKNERKLAEVSRIMEKPRSFKEKLSFMLVEREFLKAEKEALESYLTIREEERKQSKKHMNSAIAAINKIKQEVIPVFLKCGYKIISL